MSKSKNRENPRVVVKSYAELRTFARAYAEGHLNLIILVGPPGIGKTHEFVKALGKNPCVIDGNATAFGIYVRLWSSRDVNVVIDDVDSLYADRKSITLLKSLCQSAPTKSVSWISDAQTLDKLDIPQQFTTSSKVAIIANSWRKLNVNVAALEDRGHFIHFLPPPAEIHLETSKWFRDQEVFDYIGLQLTLIPQHSFRHYLRALELKRAGLDWKKYVLAQCLSGTKLAVAQLREDRNFASEAERVRAFISRGHGSRATYFNLAKTLPADRGIPAYRLNTPVPDANPRMENT